ncbi:MAG: hypothetical protein HY909_23565 [Deltaproteobacteria bacterium]|nr:hypothetical protein [Deltaproteobacteria bacterium]
MRAYFSLAVGLLALACTKPRDPRAVEPLSLGGRADASARTQDAGRPRVERRTVGFITDRQAPPGALGVRWGLSRAELANRNREAQARCRDRGAFTFCNKALVPLPLDGVVSYEFCEERLCAVAVDAAVTRDEDQLVQDYDRLVELARGELGPPASEARRVGEGCRGHLAICLTSRRADYSTRWMWQSGDQALVSLDQTEDDALQAQAGATFLSAERARRTDPVDDPLARSLLSDAGSLDAIATAPADAPREPGAPDAGRPARR